MSEAIGTAKAGREAEEQQHRSNGCAEGPVALAGTAGEELSAASAVAPEEIASLVEQALGELIAAGGLVAGSLVVIGASTSEVAGKRIGSSGSLEIARGIWEGVRRVRQTSGICPVFQCCEHLNRTLVAEREWLGRFPAWEPVSVIPVPHAGGSLAAYAYGQAVAPVVVEAVRADAAIDIGSTLIGMHLKPVAVPVRPTAKWIGEATVTMAYSRPKLIGGPRAVYDPAAARELGTCQ
ncbi:TIGR01440 family protein [Gorillibacterium timonense]|uniref:TIGR01440 family protein n=1 Tax=Gorillibacterium timonense TaxID=1689269 RepID=UPI0009EA36B3|nr:TIGR01440 family protein [Gorillibacterium timonense]